MKMFNPVLQPPGFLRKIYPEAVWRIGKDEKLLFLTFDDGPIPEVTPWILNLLDRLSVQATFFCVGENVAKYPSIYGEILQQGHKTGNHTYNHLQGLKTSTNNYIQNIEKAARYIDSDLFRPPHGLMTRSQYLSVSEKYTVVMWDLFSGDTKAGNSADKVSRDVFNHVRPGSVLTFHDSLKSFQILKSILPDIIKKLKDGGYSFLPLIHERIKGLSSHR